MSTYALDRSSLARFDTAALRRILEDRRARRRATADRFGRDSAQHRFVIASIRSVIDELETRGDRLP